MNVTTKHQSEEHPVDQARPPATRLSILNTDVLLHILSYLSVKDILNIRQTCKTLEDITRLRAVWNSALLTHVLSKDLPVAPCPEQEQHRKPEVHQDSLQNGVVNSPPSSTYTSPELEHLTRRSLSLHENWQRGRPRRRRACIIPPGPASDTGLKFVRLRFLCRHGHDYLVAFAHRVTPAAGMICIWDLTPQEPKFVGHWSSSEYNSGFMVNESSESKGVFAVSALPRSGTCRIMILGFAEDEPDPYSSITSISETIRDGQQRILALHGDRLVVTAHRPEDCIIVYDWTTDQPLFSLDSGQVAPRCLRVLWVHDFLLVFREIVLSIYRIPSSSTLSSSCTAGIVSTSSSTSEIASLIPIAIYKWTWRINSVCVTERVSYSSRTNNHSYKPLSILIRFDSFFPWPVNVIHHFILPVDPFYNSSSPVSISSSSQEASTSSITPELSSSEAEGPLPSHPYVLPPTVQSMIPSAVRLFGRSDMMISEYGTAVWLDSEPDSSSTSTPIAALTSPDEQPEDAADLYVGSSTGGGVASDTGERIAGRRLGKDVGSGGEQRTTLFATREDDGWTAFAMDERVGRLAVADADENVEVSEYI